MAHRFGPRKGPRKDRSEEAPAKDRPEKDLLSKDLLGEGLLGKELLGKDLLGEGLLGKDLPTLGREKEKVKERDQAPKEKGLPRKPFPRKGLPQRELPSSGEVPWLYIIAGGIILLGLAAGLGIGYYNKSQIPGYTAEVYVEKPTRLDWVFVANDDGKGGDPPALWMFFDTPRLSQYELFVPPSYQESSEKHYPLVLFLSPTEKPVGWSRWSKVCQEQEIIFAGVREAGKSKPFWQQVRIAFDVLDDLRRHYRIDTDRCYIVGQGESASVACQIAFGLPELFGGVVAIDGAAFLREEPYMRYQVVERLSIALATGKESEDSGVIERLFGNYFQNIGMRSKVWIIAGLADAVPPAEDLEAIYQWLEGGVEDRRKLAKQFPASRLDSDAEPFSRAQRSKMLLDEANSRLAEPKTLHSGVKLLEGIAHRYVGLPAAIESGKLLLANKFAVREEVLEAEKADQLRYALPGARALRDYLVFDFPPGVFDRNWQRNIHWGSKANYLWKHVMAQKPELAPEATKAMADIEKARQRPVTPGK